MRQKICVSPYCSWVTPRRREIEIHDTTLREGEQTPGVIFSIDDKVKIAGLLLEVGIERIEAGFPASSEIEKKAVRRIVKEYGEEKIFGFARAIKSDIDAVIDTECGGLLLSYPPSEIHLTYKLKISKEEYLMRAIEVVEYAKSHGLKVIYSAEDLTRATYEWVLRIFKNVQQAGADVLRVADTLGCILPSAMYLLISRLYDENLYPLEVHCHNDYGLALANSLAAFEAGASGVSTCVLGLGERAGITATEELILALNNLYGIKKYKTELLMRLCEFVSEKTKIPIWPTKPIVGEHAFTHYSGIHQDGVLKNPIVYESFPPELVGRKRKILLGYVSGRAVVRAKLRELGIKVDDDTVTKISMKIKEYSYMKKSAITDRELLEILSQMGVIGKGV